MTSLTPATLRPVDYVMRLRHMTRRARQPSEPARASGMNLSRSPHNLETGTHAMFKRNSDRAKDMWVAITSDVPLIPRAIAGSD